MRATRSRRTMSAFCKAHGLDALDAGQETDRLLEARPLPGRQVDLRGIAGDHHLGALAETRQEHLHLHARGILCLVQDDEGICQRAPAHEGERRDLDDAGVEVALDLLGRKHVVERVVERPEIGIDLVAHIAGQEAQPLARLDGRARENDALDHAALKAGGGKGDGEIGLAGAGRADAEDEIRLLDGADVGALRHCARRDLLAARADMGRARRGCRIRCAGCDARLGMTDQPVDVAGPDLVAVAGTLVEALEHLAGLQAGGFRADQRDDIAVRVRLDAEPLLEQRQVRVVLAEQDGQQPVVIEGGNDSLGAFAARIRARPIHLGCLRTSRRDRPACTRQISASRSGAARAGTGSFRFALLDVPTHSTDCEDLYRGT